MPKSDVTASITNARDVVIRDLGCEEVFESGPSTPIGEKRWDLAARGLLVYECWRYRIKVDAITGFCIEPEMHPKRGRAFKNCNPNPGRVEFWCSPEPDRENEKPVFSCVGSGNWIHPPIRGAEYRFLLPE